MPMPHPLYPSPDKLPESLAAELRRASRAYNRGLLLLLALLVLASVLLGACASRLVPARSYRAEHAAPAKVPADARAWHESDTLSE